MDARLRPGGMLRESVADGAQTLREVSLCRVSADSRQAVRLLCASEDGEWLASASSNCEVHVYNLHKLKVTDGPRDFQSQREIFLSPMIGYPKIHLPQKQSNNCNYNFLSVVLL